VLSTAPGSCQQDCHWRIGSERPISAFKADRIPASDIARSNAIVPHSDRLVALRPRCGYREPMPGLDQRAVNREMMLLSSPFPRG